MRNSSVRIRSAIVVLVASQLLPSSVLRAEPHVWLDAKELADLPTHGDAWHRLQEIARAPMLQVQLADQDDRMHIHVLAKALVAARTGDAVRRAEVENAILGAIGTQAGGRTLALARNLGSLVIAADLVGLSPDAEQRFRQFLGLVLDEELDGMTLRQTHERRPNNWGTHASATRAAIAAYIGAQDELARVAQVFRGWLGDRTVYASFEFGDTSWQADLHAPVGINPVAAIRDGHSIDGVLPDDQRRGGPFSWPPPHENYVYEALQGALATALILSRAGYPDVWEWQSRALLRAYIWLRDQALFPAAGDDRWQMPIVDYAYGTSFWDGGAVTPGKSIGWTDWTHGGRHAPKR
jgi:hypothetical protein